MPELPEVETVMRDIRAALKGRRFTRVTATHPKIVRHPAPAVFCRQLTGRTVESVERRGKFIVMHLDSPLELVVHLGMTGHLTIAAPGAPLPVHTHVRAGLDDGRELRYDDARRFGRVLLGPREQLEGVGVLPRLGVEPLSPEFTADSLDEMLPLSARPLKSFLLDQSRIAGLGNIYIDEACFRAGVRPQRRCNRLTRRERQALHNAIVEVLVVAIRNRGSSIGDYRDVWNSKGKHQEVLRVYGRGGMACFKCGGIVRSLVVSGRTTVYCPHCQK